MLKYTAKRITGSEAASHVVRVSAGGKYHDFKLEVGDHVKVELVCVCRIAQRGPDFASVAVQTMAFQTLVDGFERSVLK